MSKIDISFWATFVKFKNQLMVAFFVSAKLDYHGNQQTLKRRKRMYQNLPILTLTFIMAPGVHGFAGC